MEANLFIFLILLIGKVQVASMLSIFVIKQYSSNQMKASVLKVFIFFFFQTWFL